MSLDNSDSINKTYLNPVYPYSFPDPFVLKFRNEYFAYCTDFWRDGKVFGILRSRDLINWTESGGAMEQLESDVPFYWAPEVTYSNGKFYLYYSVGNETFMEIRVAVSNRPDGGFVDAGRKLTFEYFAIDAHLFTDTDGTKYLFYATDFLDHTHIGTGTVMDKMIDFFTLEGNPSPVTRAKYDWQIYDPNRLEKGNVRWHTIEGAFILKRKGIYYEMFSGGNWQNPTYGVSFATTDNLKNQTEWTQFSDGEKTFPILRTVPDIVIGPGHNSVVRGVNNRELFCLYHRWTQNGRALAIDRMDFAGNRIFIKGATHTTQIAPFAPAFADFFDDSHINENWRQIGEWEILEGEIINKAPEKSELICTKSSEYFLAEFSFRVIEGNQKEGNVGFYIQNGAEKIGEFLIFPKLRKASFSQRLDNILKVQKFNLSKDFAFEAIHLLRIEVNQKKVKILLDEVVIQLETWLEKPAANIALTSEKLQAAFSGFAITHGFEDLFEWKNSNLKQHGWHTLNNKMTSVVENGELFFLDDNNLEAILYKGIAAENFEFAANLRLVKPFSDKFAFGFAILNQNNQIISRFTFTESKGRNYLTDNKKSYKLHKNYAPENYHQFRFLKLGEKLLLQMEENELGETFVPNEKVKIGVFCRNTKIALEMVRHTIL